MSTQNPNQPAVKPGIRGDIVATLTPEEVAAAMLRFFTEAKQVNAGITITGVSINQYSCDVEPRTKWHGHGVNSACEIDQPSFTSLVAGLSRQIGPSVQAASELRETARRLLENAAMIEANIQKEAA